MYETLKQLEEKDLLKKCLQSGIIPTTLAFHKLIYENYLKNKEIMQNNRKAVVCTSIATDVTIRTVYNVIKEMEG